jgi:uncharacterized protein YbjT (DUF2867 family)
MLVISGVTGGVGGEAARRLAAAGHPLRLLARDPAQVRTFPDCEVVAADYADPAGLARSMHAGDVVFMVSLNPPPGERMRLHGNFVAAAAEAKVAHLVYLSFLSAGPAAQFLHARTHWETEELIRSSGLPFTFLRTSFYDRVTTMFYANGVALGPGGRGAVAWVSRPDCAAAVAAVMQDPAAHRGAIYDINGPEPLTLEETSALITAGSGLPYRYVDADFDPAALATTLPLPQQFLVYQRTAYLGIAAGEFATPGDDLRLLTGSRGATLAQFIAENRAAYPTPTPAP